MRVMEIAQTAQVKSVAVRSACAVMLACGLAFGSVVAQPHTAFADTDDGANTTLQERADSSVELHDNIRLTDLGSNKIKVELTDALTASTVSVQLGALNAAGASLAGCTFAFTPEALALPTCHALESGDDVALVVSNGINAISTASDDFVLGTLTVPSGTAKVAMHRLTYIGAGGGQGENSANAVGPNLGELVLNAPPDGSGDGNTNTSGNTNASGNTNTNVNTNTSGNVNANTSGNANTADKNNTNVGGNTSNKKLSQTGDGLLSDASALLLIAGAAALVAGAILFLRRKRG